VGRRIGRKDGGRSAARLALPITKLSAIELFDLLDSSGAVKGACFSPVRAMSGLVAA
jgi:hypothetical protein